MNLLKPAELGKHQDSKTASAFASPSDARCLRTKFIITSMPVGGAETLLINLIRRFDPKRISPSVVCLKEKGPLGEELSAEFPVDSHLIRSKFDFGVLFRLASNLRRNKTDAIVTVGAGDKMFWGRLAAKLAGVPVVCSALHSTGWPDGVGRLNRKLTFLTDAFIGVAKSHGEFLVNFERFPSRKVFVIPNGIDTNRFRPDSSSRDSIREELGLSSRVKLVGIVAALRPEKNHALFVRAAVKIKEQAPDAHFVIVGDGPEREEIASLIKSLGGLAFIHLLGNRSDTPRILAALDAFVLSSLNEASPVSILEALSCQVPVVASNVGSVSESVINQWNGFTFPSGDEQSLVERVVQLLRDRDLNIELGQNGREHVERNGSLDNMVELYEHLIHKIWRAKNLNKSQ
jgi:glycosyltransferase involved in cell wall biosynthesis